MTRPVPRVARGRLGKNRIRMLKEGQRRDTPTLPFRTVCKSLK